MAPRKLMVVFADAVGVPGDGNTLTDPEARTAAGRGFGSPRAPAAAQPAVAEATEPDESLGESVRGRPGASHYGVVSAFLWNR